MTDNEQDLKVDLFNTDGEILKEFRLKHQYTQQELADTLGLAQQTITMIEKNQRKAPDSLKLAFLRKFKIDFDELSNKAKNELVDAIMLNLDRATYSENMVKIPFYHVYAAAGSGETSPDYPEKDVIYFDKRWVTNVVGANPNNVAFIQAKGDSMDGGNYPIKDGDLLMVDVSDIEPVNNQVYVVRLSNQDLVVKRISKDWQGNIILTSDNPQYKNIVPASDDILTIIGRVVWNGSKETV